MHTLHCTGSVHVLMHTSHIMCIVHIQREKYKGQGRTQDRKFAQVIVVMALSIHAHCQSIFVRSHRVVEWIEEAEENSS